MKIKRKSQANQYGFIPQYRNQFERMMHNRPLDVLRFLFESNDSNFFGFDLHGDSDDDDDIGRFSSRPNLLSSPILDLNDDQIIDLTNDDEDYVQEVVINRC